MDKIMVAFEIVPWVLLAAALWFGIPEAREFQDRTQDRSWLLAVMAFRRLR